jgi:hypothetical protein
MPGISLHMQWPLTSQLHGSFSQREHLVICNGSNSTPLSNYVGVSPPSYGVARWFIFIQNPNLGIFWRAFERKMCVLFGHLV